MSKQRDYQKRMKAQGRCIICGSNAVTAMHCETHAQQHRDRAREAARKKRNQKS